LAVGTTFRGRTFLPLATDAFAASGAADDLALEVRAACADVALDVVLAEPLVCSEAASPSSASSSVLAFGICRLRWGSFLPWRSSTAGLPKASGATGTKAVQNMYIQRTASKSVPCETTSSLLASSSESCLVTMYWPSGSHFFWSRQSPTKVTSK